MQSTILKAAKWVAVTIFCLLSALFFFYAYWGISFFFTTVLLYVWLFIAVVAIYRRKWLTKNIFLATVSVILSLFAGETVLRYVVRYPLTYGEIDGGGYQSPYRMAYLYSLGKLWFNGQSSAHLCVKEPYFIDEVATTDFSYVDTFNVLGLRGKLPDTDSNLILTLGDSFCEGAGAPADSTFPSLLSHYLAATDTPLKVLNAGVSGSDIFFSYKVLQWLVADWQVETASRVQPKYHFKEVIIMLNSTDIGDVATAGGMERFRPDGTVQFKNGPWWEPAFAASYIVRLVVINAMQRDFFFRTTEQTAEVNEEALKTIRSFIETELVPYATAKGFKLTLVLHPTEAEARNNDRDFTLMQKYLTGIKGATVIDVTPQVQAALKGQQLYWKNDLHFNATGYRLVAETVARQMLVSRP